MTAIRPGMSLGAAAVALRGDELPTEDRAREMHLCATCLEPLPYDILDPVTWTVVRYNSGLRFREDGKLIRECFRCLERVGIILS